MNSTAQSQKPDLVRIAQISDLHCNASSKWSERFDQVTACLEKELPDVLLITGDVVFYPAFTLAKTHAGLGNVEQALDWLEIAVDEKLFGYYLPSVDQVWDPLREHPRFRRVLQRFGVPDSQGNGVKQEVKAPVTGFSAALS